jgi:hydroxyacylglutathione hydrolase
MSQANPPVPGVVVGDGIGRVPGFVNSYILSRPGGYWMIDTSFSKRASGITAAFKRAGQSTSSIQSILLTHYHLDHMGGAARLRQESRSGVSCHAQDAPYVDGRQRQPMGAIMRLLFGPKPVPVAATLQEAQMVGPLRVLHVPGHTDGSIAFYDAERKVLFAGDALRVEKKGNLGFPAPKYAANLVQAVESLKRFQGLEVRRMLPGHGEPVGPDFPSLLDDLIKRAPRDYLNR